MITASLFAAFVAGFAFRWLKDLSKQEEKEDGNTIERKRATDL